MSNKYIAVGYNFVTKKEKKVCDLLIEAWNGYIKLEVQHPSEQTDFTNAIHTCQQLLAIRVARKSEPKMYPTHKVRKK